ncbi:MAG: PadR family transcriptional regulator, partial [Hyphomicrobiaceae bacterium]
MNVRTLCLGILYFGEATGYEIRKTASEGGFSHFIEANYGSIYPALTKLTQDELVTMREEVVSGKPSRKVYALTDQGREALKAALNEPLRADIF